MGWWLHDQPLAALRMNARLKVRLEKSTLQCFVGSVRPSAAVRLGLPGPPRGPCENAPYYRSVASQENTSTRSR